MRYQAGSTPGVGQAPAHGIVRWLAVAAAVLVTSAVAACGKGESRGADTQTTDSVAAATASSCVHGAFDPDVQGRPQGLKLTGGGSAPGWYAWIAGPYLRVRLVSDPAHPLAPVPSTDTTERKKSATTVPVTMSYNGEVRATASLGKLTVVPDASAGVVEASASRVTFALNGQVGAVGFDVVVPCGAKTLQLSFDVPAVGAAKPAGVDKIFIGANGHPLANPVLLKRIPDPNAPTTTMPMAATKPNKPTKPASPTTTRPTATAPPASTTTKP